MTEKQFHIRHPAQIWQWEQGLKTGRLKPDKQKQTGNMTKQDDDKIKTLEAENELLRIKVAYLEKLAALAQEKNYKPRQSGYNHCAETRTQVSIETGPSSGRNV